MDQQSDPRYEPLEARVIALESGMARLDKDVKTNTELTQQVKNNTDQLLRSMQDLVEIWNSSKVVGGLAGRFVRWATPVAVAIGGYWVWFKGGK